MKRWLRILLQIASIGLFILIAWWSGGEAWLQVLEGLPQFVLLVLLLRGASGMVAASRIKLVASAFSGRNIGWRRLYHLTMSARALGLIVPRSLSTIGGKTVALRAYGIPLRRSVWVILLDNLFDVSLLAAICLPGAFYLRGTLSAQGFVIAVAALVVLVGIGIWWTVSSPRVSKWLVVMAHRFPALRRRLGLEPEADRLPLPSPQTSMQMFLLSVLLNGLLAASFYYMDQAIGGRTSLFVFLAAFPFAQLSLIAAVTPGGLGLFDLGWLGLLRLAGVAQADALGFVVAQRVYVTVFVLVWAGFSTLLSLTIKGQPESQAADE